MRTATFEIADGIYRISVAPPGNFEYNHFIIVDEHPVLIHTGRVLWFAELQARVAELIQIDRLRYIAFSHYEADECGALNEWLEVAPHAVPLVNRVGQASIEDFSHRPPEIVTDGQTIPLGTHKLLVLETPHFPHNWDACLYFERTTGVLFSSDLGAHPGVAEPTTSADLTPQILRLQQKMGFMPAGPALVAAIDKLAALNIRFLATQHGSTIGGKSIPRLLQHLKAQLGCTLLGEES